MTTLRLQQGRFIGRQAELQQLDQQLAQYPGAWLVGEAGVGRTRLALEWAQRQQRVAFLLRVTGLEPPDELLSMIGRATGQRLSHWSQLDALNAVIVLQITAPDTARPSSWPWSPEPRTTNTRLLLVANHRPEKTEADAHAAAWPIVELSGLSYIGMNHADSFAVQLYLTRIEERVDPLVVPRNLEPVARLVELLQGMPLWLELAASAALVLPAGQLLERLQSDGLRVLPGADQLLEAALEGLAPRDVQLLQLMARLDAPFDAADAQSMTGTVHADAHGGLLRLAQRHLIEVRAPDPDTRIFQVPRLLVGALQRLEFSEAQRISLLDWALAPERSWFGKAGWVTAPPGARWALQAAVARGEIARWRTIARLLRDGLGTVPADDAIAVADALIQAFEAHPEATAADRAMLFDQRSVLRRLVANLDGALEDASRALQALHGAPYERDRVLGELRSGIFAGLSVIHRLRGDDDAALRAAHDAAAAALSVGAFAQEIQARAGAVTLLQERGRMDEAEALIVRQLARCRELQDRRREAATRVQLGNVFRDRGRPDEALQEYRAARTLYEALGLAWATGVVDGHVAGALHESGQLDAAERTYAAARESVVQSELVRSELMFALGHGGVLAEQGAMDSAEEAWGKAEGLMAMFDEPGYAVALRLMRTLAHVSTCAQARRAGDDERADAILATVLETISWAEESPDAESRSRVARLDDARYALRRLRALIASLPPRTRGPNERCLRVSAAADSLTTPDGTTISLARRQVLQRTLRLLVESRLQSPGKSITNEALIAHVWRGVRMSEAIALQRLRATMWELRKTGLYDLLVNDHGYRLDENTPLEVV